MAGAPTALAGGAIGSLVTLAATAGVRFYAARGEIETHDRLVDDLNEDLERWVVDDTARLVRELRDLRNDLNKRNAFYSGEYGFQLGTAKERALQAYRDQETRASREAATIPDREGWMHEFWRRWRRKPRHELTAPSRVKPVVDLWRLTPSKHLQPEETPPPVDDPSARTLDEVIDDVTADPSRFV
jgi:hypothetical protein